MTAPDDPYTGCGMHRSGVSDASRWTVTSALGPDRRRSRDAELNVRVLMTGETRATANPWRIRRLELTDQSPVGQGPRQQSRPE